MNKTSILVVEDDKAVRNLIATTLETQGYDYLTAETGASALMQAVSGHPDIIILDLGLPDMDGVEIIRKVRGWSSLPIIVVSARSEDRDKISALDAGADDYLTKPFSADELLARVRVALRRIRYDSARQGTESSVFENGGLKIDYAAGCAYVDGEEVHLTPIEYKLLCLLARNVGKVLTQRPAERHPLAAGVHGHPPQKNRKDPLPAEIYPDPRGRGLPDAPHRERRRGRRLTA